MVLDELPCGTIEYRGAKGEFEIARSQVGKSRPGAPNSVFSSDWLGQPPVRIRSKGFVGFGFHAIAALGGSVKQEDTGFMATVRLDEGIFSVRE
jgi:hypothetical protein